MTIPEVGSMESIIQEAFQIPAPVVETQQPANEPVVDQEKPTPQSLGGDRFDFDGNLLKNNVIIKTVAELKADSDKTKEDSTDNKEDEAEEEEVEMSVNANGDLIDKEGKVVKKAGEFKLGADNKVIFEDEPLVKTIAEAYKAKGYQLLGEDNQPLIFEDTDEGYQALTGAIALEEADRYINEYIENTPEVVGLANHLRAGGNAMDYFKSRVSTVDYTSIDKLSEEGDQEAVIVDMFMKINSMPEVEAKDIAKMYKAAGILEAKSKAALTSLQEWQKTNEDNRQKDVIDQIKAQEIAAAKVVTDIKQTVLNGKLGNFEIPVAERQKFTDFLTKPIGEGHTESSKRYDALPLDQKLALEYLAYINFDVDALVKIKLNQEKADMFKKRSNNSSRVIIKENLQRNAGQGEIPDLKNVT